MIKKCILFTLIFYCSVVAQPNQQSFSVYDSLMLNITFPADQDTFALDNIRLSGYTDPKATVFINSDRVRVYPHGAFVSRIALQPDSNQINIRAERNGQVAYQTLHIYRPPDLKTSPEFPTQIDSNLIEPAKDQWIMPGDFFQVRFKASPNALSTFSIDKQTKNTRMVELSPRETWGLEGIYNGIIKIKPTSSHSPHKIKFNLLGKDGKKIKFEAPGRLFVLPEDIPIIGRTITKTELKNDWQNGASLGKISDSTRVQIIGRKGSSYKITLGDHKSAFIDIKNIELLPFGSPIPNTTVSTPSISYEKDWIKLSMSVNESVPYMIKQSIDPTFIELYLYNARQGSQWTTYPNGLSEIKKLFWEQVEENVLKIHIGLKQNLLWGHKISYSNNKLVLRIRRKPYIAPRPASPTNGLTIVLDPGHGGENDLGAISPVGLYEKDINLKWAKYLAEMLRNSRAHVVLTRQTDDSLSLRQRTEIALDANAHIFISLHNNATGLASNPTRARGTSIFFNTPQSQSLAYAIYPHMVKTGLAPMGRSFTSFYVTRNSAMPAILVEGAFMSSPDDEQLLMQDLFIKKMARAVFTGLEEFLLKQK